MKLGHAPLFELHEIVALGGIEVGRTRDPEGVASIIGAGNARFLIDANGERLHMEPTKDQGTE